MMEFVRRAFIIVVIAMFAPGCPGQSEWTDPGGHADVISGDAFDDDGTAFDLSADDRSDNSESFEDVSDSGTIEPVHDSAEDAVHHQDAPASEAACDPELFAWDGFDGPVVEVLQPDGEWWPQEKCTYFLTGEVDLEGEDADGDGVPNSWDQCPRNPFDWADSDRDGIGNKSDPDIDYDEIPPVEDTDWDGDGISNADEETAGTDPKDPASIPGLATFDIDPGIRSAASGWYAGDFHLHAQFKPGRGDELSELFGPVEWYGLDFIAVTDSWTFDERLVDPYWSDSTEAEGRRPLLIQGAEWGAVGHIGLVGMRTAPPDEASGAAEVRNAMKLARFQGGMVVLNHYGSDAEYWDGILKSAPDIHRYLGAIEIWNSHWAGATDTNEPSIAFWEKMLNSGRHVPAVGGGDAILPLDGPDGPTTIVWSESLSVPGILHGVRSGRTYLTQSDAHTCGGRPALDFRADGDGDGEYESMIGDTVPHGDVAFIIRVRNALGPVVVVRGGDVLKSFADHAPGSDVEYTFSDAAPSKAWYRIEMRESGDPGASMRLMSSPIYVSR